MSAAVDAIESIIGRSGKYQSWIMFLILIGRFPTEYQITNVVFILPNVEYVCMDEDANNLTNHCPCENPSYDVSSIQNSVTSEWNLICERGHLASLTQSLLQVGILAGSLVFGHISDRYGRKMACLLALFAEVMFAALSAVVPELWMFMLCRFLIGTAAGGSMLCCYVILVELCGKSFRPYLAGLNEVSYVMAYFTLPIFAYFIRDWRQLQMATSIPWIFVMFYICLIPESPRWLITMGQEERAIEILTNIAQKNKLPTENIRSTVEDIMKETQVQNGNQKNYSYLDLFKTPKVRIYTIIMALVWMCCANTFFGVNQYIGRLQGNIYLNVMLSAASHVPGLIIVVLASMYLRRKISVITSFVTAGISLLVFLFLPSDRRVLERTFMVIGLTGAYTSFVQIYLFSSEIFPTVIRNSAMGFTSVFARIGGLIAPFIVNIGIESISISIFSALAFCAGCLCYFLPETKGTVLLNTIDQTEISNNSKTRS